MTENKKKILYFISLNSIIEYGENVLNKIHEDIKTFGEYGDSLHVLWQQDFVMDAGEEEQVTETYTGMEVLLGEAVDKHIREYMRIRKEYEALEFVTVISPRDMAHSVEVADAFYGDSGQAAQLMLQSDKPVMVMKY